MSEPSAADRAKGYIRPVRFKYLHSKCGWETRIGSVIAEEWARKPDRAPIVFCVHCRVYAPVDQFTWGGTNEKVGS